MCGAVRPKLFLHKVQKVINFSARVIAGTRKFDHITPVLDSRGWPSIETLVGRGDALKVFKVLSDPDMPAAIRAMFVRRADVSSRQTRRSEWGDLHLPKLRLTASQRFFSYRAAKTWNGLPPADTAPRTATAFKNHVCHCIV